MLASVQYLLQEPNEMVEATFKTAVKWKKEEKKKSKTVTALWMVLWNDRK